MDKNAIKKYAIWARRELIARVSQRAALYEITVEGYGEADAVSVHGHILSLEEKTQRRALIAQIQQKGFEQVMEEIAYTWFNRFSALRFMEVNGYLPTRIRVFTDEENNFKPQIMTEAINLEMDGLDMQKVFAFKDANDDDGLFKYLIITQCNALSSVLPGMFQRISDYTELLFPDNLLREGSVVEQMVTMIPEEDWTDQVQIIGWLYEAYNTELNALVYDGSLSSSKIPKELVPAATTIFTPDWPVHYMVENSLGRLWLEGHPNDNLKSEWKYYLDEPTQEPEVQLKLANIRKQYVALKPEDILVFDPCVGSGHILCVLFDILINIYEDFGYSAGEATISIVKNNIWGLDINTRAAQLAYFAVMMKARKYNRRFFNSGVQPNVYAIQESNTINRVHLNYLGCNFNESERKSAIEQINELLNEFIDAKEYGSILKSREFDWALLTCFVENATPRQQSTFEEIGLDLTQAQIKHMIAQGKALSQKYHVVVTNPPYLSSSRFSSKLDSHIKENWKEVKGDLSMVMYQHAVKDFTRQDGFVSFITTSSWMFLSSFERFRTNMVKRVAITSLVDCGTELFDGKVGHNPIVSWVVRPLSLHDYSMVAVRLVDYCYSKRDEKEPEFLSGRNRYVIKQDSFSKIPGTPIAYWVSKNVIRLFTNKTLYNFADVQEGLKTGNNDKYIRYWFEVSSDKTNIYGNNNAKWIYHTKGGPFRKWYGNKIELLNFENDGEELKAFSGASLSGSQNYFREGITYNRITSSKTGFRYTDVNSIPNMAGLTLYLKDKKKTFYCLAWLNSEVVRYLLTITNPTINFPPGTIGNLPMFFKEDKEQVIEKMVKENIEISKEDWNAFELSWDFEVHPLIRSFLTKGKRQECVEKAFAIWKNRCEELFFKLKSNEEALNKYFITDCSLQNELSPFVEDKDITIRRADLQREIHSLISYAVGCMFGRYSLDFSGLVYAGGKWDTAKYKSFEVDSDGIIPICDDEYFNDDIVSRFVNFVEVVYGKETLEENLKFIADALGGTGTSREIIRNYFKNGFYADHLKVYQKRPIYWLFDSGKKNGFKCLVYMHRYQPDTIARIRTDYVHEQQSRYRTAMTDLQNRIDNASTTSERVKLTKKLKTIREQDEELRIYEEKIHHLADQMIKIDLDDGVKVNYAKFQDVLAKIK